MRYEDENIWLTQKMMATLYDVELSTINEHIKKVFNDSELEEKATIRKFRIVLWLRWAYLLSFSSKSKIDWTNVA